MKKMLRKFAAAAFVIGFAVSGALAQSQQTNPEKLAELERLGIKDEAPAAAKQEVKQEVKITNSNLPKGDIYNSSSERSTGTANKTVTVTSKTNAATVVIPSKVTPNANIKMMDTSKPAKVAHQPERVSNVHKAVPANYNPADYGIIDNGSKTDN